MRHYVNLRKNISKCYYELIVFSVKSFSTCTIYLYYCLIYVIFNMYSMILQMTYPACETQWRGTERYKDVEKNRSHFFYFKLKIIGTITT